MSGRCFRRMHTPVFFKFCLQVLSVILAVIAVCYLVSFLISHIYTIIALGILVALIALIQYIISCLH